MPGVQKNALIIRASQYRTFRELYLVVDLYMKQGCVVCNSSILNEYFELGADIRYIPNKLPPVSVLKPYLIALG